MNAKVLAKVTPGLWAFYLNLGVFGGVITLANLSDVTPQTVGVVLSIGALVLWFYQMVVLIRHWPDKRLRALIDLCAEVNDQEDQAQWKKLILGVESTSVPVHTTLHPYKGAHGVLIIPMWPRYNIHLGDLGRLRVAVTHRMTVSTLVIIMYNLDPEGVPLKVVIQGCINQSHPANSSWVML